MNIGWFHVCFRPKEPKFNTRIQRNTLQRKNFVALSKNETRDSCSEKKINDDGKPGRRRFHRVFKTIFSNLTSSLSKKKRNKRSGKDTDSFSISSKFEKIFNTSSEKKSKSILSSLESFNNSNRNSSLFSSQRCSSSLRSSSSFSSTSSISSKFCNSKRVSSGRKLQTGMIDMKELRPNKAGMIDMKELRPNKAITIHPTQKKEEKDGKFSTETMGLHYLILICLVGLIFWGKAFAVLCTLTCLSFFPSIFKGVANLEETGDHSDEYSKKKVIMKGILQRNRLRKL